MGFKEKNSSVNATNPDVPRRNQQTSEKHESSKNRKMNKEYGTLYRSSGGTKQALIGGVLTKTHTYILKQALAILENDKGPSCLTEEKYATILLVYTDWPDRIGRETDCVSWAGHFYNPETNTNYKGNMTPTALSRAVEHFNNAIKKYQAGEYIKAVEALGKGTHYVGDLNEPHHASNITAVKVGHRHINFEKYADEHCKEFYFENDTIDGHYYEQAKKLPIGHILKQAAWFGHNFLDKAEERNTFHEAADATIKNSIISVVQYIYKFGVIIGIYE